MQIVTSYGPVCFLSVCIVVKPTDADADIYKLLCCLSVCIVVKPIDVITPTDANSYKLWTCVNVI